MNRGGNEFHLPKPKPSEFVPGAALKRLLAEVAKLKPLAARRPRLGQDSAWVYREAAVILDAVEAVLAQIDLRVIEASHEGEQTAHLIERLTADKKRLTKSRNALAVLLGIGAALALAFPASFGIDRLTAFYFCAALAVYGLIFAR